MTSAARSPLAPPARPLARLLATLGALALATLLLGTTACGHHAIAGPVSIDGVYALTRVDDVTVPSALPANSENITDVAAGALEIAGTSFTLSLTVTQNGQRFTATSSGTVGRSANAVGFTGSFNGESGTLPGRVVDDTGRHIEILAIIAGGSHQLRFDR